MLAAPDEPLPQVRTLAASTHTGFIEYLDFQQALPQTDLFLLLLTFWKVFQKVFKVYFSYLFNRGLGCLT